MKKVFILLALFSFYFAQAADFLMPEEAFKPYASVNEKMQIEAGITLGKDIYLYADKVTLKLAEPSTVLIDNIEKTESVLHHEEQVYLISPEFLLSLRTP